MSDAPRRRRSRVRRWLILGAAVAALAVIAAGGVAVRQYMKQRNAAEGLRIGVAAYDAGDWETARHSLGRYLALHPDDVGVLAKYADAQLWKRPATAPQIAAAAGAFRRILRLDPTNVAVFDRVAAIYESTGNFAELGQIASGRKAASPDDARAAAALGLEALARQRPADAVELLEPIVARSSVDPVDRTPVAEAYLLLAEAETQMSTRGASPRARELITEGARRFPDAALLRVQRASYLIDEALGQPADRAQELKAESRAELDAAERLAPPDPRALIAAIEQRLRLGDLDRAERLLETARGLDEREVQKSIADPGNWKVAQFLQAGKLMLVSRRGEDGVRLAREAIEALTDASYRAAILPMAVELHVLGGQVSDARKYFDEYMAMLNQASPGASAPEQVVLLQAVLTQAEGKPYEVIRLLEPIVSRGSASTLAATMLSDAYMRTGQERRAADLLANAGAGTLMAADLGVAIARGQAARGEWRAAEASLAALPAEEQHKPQVRALAAAARLGQALERSTDRAALDPLVAELREIIAADPANSEPRLVVASALAILGDRTGAEDELRRAVAECAPSLPASLALARLLASEGRADDADAALAAAAEKSPAEAAPWIARAVLRVEAQRVDEAITLLSSAAEQAAGGGVARELRAQLAVLQIVRGDRAAGTALLRKLVDESPGDARLRAALLDAPGSLENLEEASRLVDQIREIEGEPGLLWRLHRARVLLAGREWQSVSEQARTLLSYCVQADPKWAAPVILLGGLYERLGDQPNAEATYTAGYRATGDATIGDRLLDLLRRQRRFVDARELLHRMEQVLGERAMQTRRLELALGEGREAEALRQLELAAADDAGGESLVRLAMLTYRSRGEAADALKLIEQAEKRGVDPVQAARARVTILNAERRRDEAAAIIESLLASSASADVYLLAGSFYAEAGDAAKANAAFARLAESSDDATGFAVQGEHLAQGGQLNEAIAVWQAGLERFPESALLMRGLVKALLLRHGTGDRETAQALLVRLEAAAPGDTEVLFVRALERAESDEAGVDGVVRGLLERAATSPPARADVYRGLASMALDRQWIPLGKSLVLRGLTYHPEDAGLLALRGQVALIEGDADALRDTAANLERAAPSDRRGLILALEAAVMQKDTAALRAGLGRVSAMVEASPDDAGARVLLSQVHEALGQREQAIDGLREFCNSDAGRSAAAPRLQLAELLNRAGAVDEALEAVDGALAIEPDSPAAHAARMTYLARAGRLPEVESQAMELAARGAGQIGLVMQAALLLSDAPNGGEAALRAARRAVELDGTNVVAQKLLGDLEYAQRNFDAAEAIYRKVLELEPNEAAAANNLAWLLAVDRGRPEQALPYAEKAAAAAPENPDFRDTLALVLRKLGRNAEARDEYRRVVEFAAPQSPGRARALLELCRVSRDLGDFSGVRGFEGEVATLIRAEGSPLDPAERSELQSLSEHFATRQ